VVQRRLGLDEQHRILGNGGAGFLGVLAVVEADAIDGGRHHRRQAHGAGRRDLVRGAPGAEHIAFDQPELAVRLFQGVPRTGGGLDAGDAGHGVSSSDAMPAPRTGAAPADSVRAAAGHHAVGKARAAASTRRAR
jgi:hypothetical protein